ncbi:MAG: UPF0175 family protein [Burkholderiales bacterium]
MHIVLEDEALAGARMSEEEIKLELALSLYNLGRLTLGQAARVAGTGQWKFQQTLAARGIPVHYDEDELEADRGQLERLGWR